MKFLIMYKDLDNNKAEQFTREFDSTADVRKFYKDLQDEIQFEDFHAYKEIEHETKSYTKPYSEWSDEKKAKSLAYSKAWRNKQKTARDKRLKEEKAS